MAPDPHHPVTWWGSFPLARERAARWQIGPLTLTALRRAQEWRLSWQWATADEDGKLPWSFEAEAPEVELEHVERHVFRQAPEALTVLPALADRPVVTSPRTPLYLPSGESATLYMGSPLWVRLSVGEPSRELREIPIRRPSDTWFGPSTLEGEACYATRTWAVLELGEVTPQRSQAITPVTLRNQSSEPLAVEKLKLPVPYLALYAAAGGTLWTEAVTLSRREGSEMAVVEIDHRPPHAAAGERLATPRETAEERLLTRAFSSLIKKGGG